jgi:hypothetical protein
MTDGTGLPPQGYPPAVYPQRPSSLKGLWIALAIVGALFTCCCGNVAAVIFVVVNSASGGRLLGG